VRVARIQQVHTVCHQAQHAARNTTGTASGRMDKEDRGVSLGCQTDLARGTARDRPLSACSGTVHHRAQHTAPVRCADGQAMINHKDVHADHGEQAQRKEQELMVELPASCGPWDRSSPAAQSTERINATQITKARAEVNDASDRGDMRRMRWRTVCDCVGIGV
jgi:hypothetical protein